MKKSRILISILIFGLLGAVLVLATVKTAQMNKWEYTRNRTPDVTGKMIGLTIEDPKDVNGLAELPDILSWFENWYDDSSSLKLELCGRNNAAIPLITWQPTDIPPEEIAAGLHDDYIKEFFQRIAKTCPNETVLIRYAHEMEMSPNYGHPWFSWQGADPESYIQAWQHLTTLSDEICPQIKWIWSPNRMTRYAEPYYPGDEYVDYVGLTVNITSPQAYRYSDFGTFYIEKCGGQMLQQYDKPVIISETGYSPPQFGEDCSAAFIRSVFDYFQQDDDMTAAVFFNTDSRENRYYRFTDDPMCLKTFNEEMLALHEKQEDADEKE